MRLGLNLGYWGTTGTDDMTSMLALATRARDEGYAIGWLAEAYGSDIPSLTGWLAAQLPDLAWGSAVMQIPARTPAMTAMTAATLDRITGGKFCLGLGVSGPQVSEGWHGVRFDRPLERTREYVEIVQLALGRKNVEFHGRHFDLPLPDGPGKALRLLLLPERPQVPIYLASIGPKNLELTGEIADGWLGIFVSPDYLGEQLTLIDAGRAKRGMDREGFDVAATVALSVGDGAEAVDRLRPNAALYVGGMGSAKQNFYNQLACRMGFEDDAAKVQRLYLGRQPRDAAAAVPEEFIRRTSLVGSPEQIEESLVAYARAGVTTLNVSPYGENLQDRLAALTTLADCARRAGIL